MSVLVVNRLPNAVRHTRTLFVLTTPRHTTQFTDKETNYSSVTQGLTRNVVTSAITARRSLIGPSVRILLHHYKLNESEIKASGPHNVLMKSDVLEYIKQQNLKPADKESPADRGKSERKGIAFVRKEKFKDTELSNMRRTIAKRLTQSKTTIPHSYMSAECSINAVMKMRKRMEKDKIKVSVNDFVIKAAAIALKKVKEVNVTIDESKNLIKSLPNVDISVAVATNSGLITPIVKDANKLSVPEINAAVKDLANKARQGKLQPHEFQGGTFSISNLGMFGISEFIAVINPPQCAILAVGTSRLTADEEGEVIQRMTVTLSYDARAINEEICAKFLEVFRDLMESPEKLEKAGDGSDLRRLSYLCS